MGAKFVGATYSHSPYRVFEINTFIFCSCQWTKLNGSSLLMAFLFTISTLKSYSIALLVQQETFHVCSDTLTFYTSIKNLFLDTTNSVTPAEFHGRHIPMKWAMERYYQWLLHMMYEKFFPIPRSLIIHFNRFLSKNTCHVLKVQQDLQ